MSLTYESIKRYISAGSVVSKENREIIEKYMRHIGILSDDYEQFTEFNMLDVLFSKIKRVKIRIVRTDRNGIEIDIIYHLVPDNIANLFIHHKRVSDITLAMKEDANAGSYEYDKPISVMTQKLFLSRLPVNVGNVLMYYIYSSQGLNWRNIEGQLPSDWKLDNRWDVASYFVFSIIETLNHSQYKGLPYKIELDMHLCKGNCELVNEESIIVNKMFSPK